jgi:hypothetical protein
MLFHRRAPDYSGVIYTPEKRPNPFRNNPEVETSHNFLLVSLF